MNRISLIVCVGFPFIGFISCMSVRTFPDHLRVSWSPVSTPPQQWTITYTVMGTSYHSVLKVPGNITSANITTADYPGVLYKVNLYASTNGTPEHRGTGCGRSDCSKYVNTSIGSSYPYESHDYHGGMIGSAICTWTFTGSDNTWYKFKLDDFDIDNTSCNSYLMVGSERICGNKIVNSTMLVYQPVFVVKLVYIASGGNEVVKFHISAIHKVLQPSNVTAETIGNAIAVCWIQPDYHPTKFSYILRISHYPFSSSMDVALAGNLTRYTYHVTSHVGQNFSMQLQSVSDDLNSTFTDPVFVSTSCDKDVFIKATEKTAFVSEQYPHEYLPQLSCHFRFQTEASFYLLFVTHDLDIGKGQMCDKTYLELEGHGKFCADATPPMRLVIQMSSANIVYRTDEKVHGKGFNMTISSVARPPSAPNNVVATSDDTSIYIVWEPPSSQQVYVQGYTVQYFIAPHTPGATLSVGRAVRNITINVQSHPGRLYALRIAAFTEGGVGNFSHPFYVRAGCGKNINLMRHESFVLTSPLNEKGFYGPDTVCQWTVKAEPTLWMKITIHKLMLEVSDNCSKDYVEITGVGRLCGEHAQSDAMVKDTDVVITFRSDSWNESEGFSISVRAVGPAPGEPRTFSVSQASYGIVIKWTPPITYRRFVTGYVIHHAFYGEKTANKTRIDANTEYHVLDMTSHPGRLVEIWLQAEGDVEPSTVTKSLFIRSTCGQTVDLSGKYYITSPYYENNSYNNIQCLWTIKIQNHFLVKLEFLRLNMNNNPKTCENFILLNNASQYCDETYENKSAVLNSTRLLTLQFRTGLAGRGARFLLSVEPIRESRPKPVISSTISSSADLMCSSTALLVTSYFGTLMASSFMVSSILSSTDDNMTDESQKEVDILQTSMSSHPRAYHHTGETLEKTIVTDAIHHSTERFLALESTPMPKRTATSNETSTARYSNLGVKLTYDISPTRASSFVPLSGTIETLTSVLLSSSYKCITLSSNYTTSLTSSEGQVNRWKNVVSLFENNINQKASSTSVLRTLDIKSVSVSRRTMESSEVNRWKDTQIGDNSISGSMFSAKSSFGISISPRDASNVLISRNIANKDGTPEDKRQDDRNAAHHAGEAHIVVHLLMINITVMFVFC